MTDERTNNPLTLIRWASNALDLAYRVAQSDEAESRKDAERLTRLALTHTIDAIAALSGIPTKATIPAIARCNGETPCVQTRCVWEELGDPRPTWCKRHDEDVNPSCADCGRPKKGHEWHRHPFREKPIPECFAAGCRNPANVGSKEDSELCEKHQRRGRGY